MNEWMVKVWGKMLDYIGVDYKVENSQESQESQEDDWQTIEYVI